MRLFLKVLRVGLVGLAIILVLPVLFIVERLSWLPRSVAPQSGELTAAGITGDMRIVRDRNAVPHIAGVSVEDVYFGLGFAHAQDRLWQMAFYRRALQGRLAELIGPMGVRTDTFIRAIDLEGRARDCITHLSPETRRALEAYAAGVNAWAGARRANLPPEFHLMMTGFDAWKPEHSVLMLKFMAMNLSDNAPGEVQHARLIAALGAERAGELFPPPNPKDPVPLRDAVLAEHASLFEADPLVDRLTRLRGASNNWVVAGRLTKSGKPLLANDPHLGLSAPGIWYLVHMALPTGDVVGATIPGIPSVVLGHNSHIAWGFTTAQADTEDLVIETVHPDDPSRYLTPTGSLPFVTRETEIKVRLGGIKRVTLRETRHGPVLPPIARALDEITPKNAVVALAAAGLARDDTTMQAAIEMMSAHTLSAMNAAFEKFKSPMQNIVFATINGDIGYAAPATVPIRGPKAPPGSIVPADGKEQEQLWVGSIPYAGLPHLLNPASGRIFTANSKIVPDDYPYFLTTDWPPAYRTRRIGELLASGMPFDLDYMEAMQKDARAPEAVEVLPLLLQAKPEGEREQAAAKLLSSWDYEMHGDRPEPLIFIAWETRFQHLITEDEFGKLAGEMRGPRPPFLLRVLTNTDGMAHWCDDTRTEDVTETCDQMSARALGQALDRLTTAHGSDMNAWRWDVAHTAVFDHQSLGSIPVIGGFFNRTIASAGGPNSLDRGDMAYAGLQPYNNIHAAGMRAVYDLADLSKSRFMIAIGQSGNPLSPYYDDLISDWAAGKSFEIPMDEAKYTDGSPGTWVIRPAHSAK